jgi:tetratricopeptide (TPR) repeat protein
MKKLFLLPFVVALLLGAALNGNAKIQWKKIESPNFVLMGDASESDMRKLAAKLEQFRLSLNTLFPALKLDTKSPTRVYIFRDNGAFQPFRPSYNGKIRSNVGGYFLAWPNLNIIALTVDSQNGDPLRPVFHEYEHFLINKNLGPVPAWLDEGLAEFFSTFYVSSGGKKAVIGDPIAHHGDLLRRESIWPLAKLFAVDRRSPEYNESTKAGIFYAESWALVHYLMFQDLKNGTEQFSQFIQLLTREVSIADAFQTAFKRDYRKVEQELRDYLGKYSFPAMDVEFHEPVGHSAELPSVMLTEAESESFAGDLLYRLGRVPDAESHLLRSVTLDPYLAGAHFMLAAIRRNQDRLDDAIREIDKAITLDPRNHLYYLSRAIATQRQGAGAATMDDFRKALEIQPNDSQAHFQFGLYLATLGSDENAVSEFSTAIRFDNANAEPYRALAFALFRLGRDKYAIQAAQNYLKLQGWDAPYSEYMVMVASLAYRQAGDESRAVEVVAAARRHLSDPSWPDAVFRYLSGELTAEALLTEAKDDDQRTEAHAFIGLHLSLTKKFGDARTHLEWVVNRGQQKSIANWLASQELKRLSVVEPPRE